MTEIFDAHIHCSELPDDGLYQYAKANSLDYNLKELLGLMKKHDVRSGLLLSPPLKTGLPAPNERIIELSERSNGKLYPILTVEPNAQSVNKAMKLAAEEREVKGFKIRLGYVEAFPYSKVFAPLYTYAESKDLPVLFHTGDTATPNGSLRHSHPLGLDTLANERPNLKIIACHFGNPWIMDTAELLYKHENLFADVSGLFAGGSKYSEMYLDYLAKTISEAIYHAGSADKILFGTDYPIENFADAISLVNKLGIDASDEQKIFSRNAKRLFLI